MKQVARIKQRLCSWRRADLIKRATPSELSMKAMLDSLSVRYMFQKGFIAGDYFCIVDFYLPKPYRICIEVDGPCHALPKQVVRDTQKDAYLNARGFKVLRITNEGVEHMSADDLSSLLQRKGE